MSIYLFLAFILILAISLTPMIVGIIYYNKAISNKEDIPWWTVGLIILGIILGIIGTIILFRYSSN